MNGTPQSLAELSNSEKREMLLNLLKQKKQATAMPLSYGQKALYFLQISAPDSFAYNISFAGRILSAVDAQAMKRALQTLINRHDQLRANFVMGNEGPMQRIAGEQEIAFQTLDAAGWSEQHLFEAMQKAYQQPFDLEAGPVFRAHLFTCSPQEHLILITTHHIVYDAWSLWMNQMELAALYAQEVSGKAADLPVINYAYFDFVDWQKRMLSKDEGEALWHYWRKTLQGELPTLNLPTDRPRPPVQTFNGRSCPFQLDAKFTAELKSLSRQEGATLFMLLLAAYKVLLYRYTAQEDILVGTPAACRNQVEFSGVVGYFVNPLVLRSNLSGNPAFADFLAQVKDTLLTALDHQEFPFPLLVERLHPIRDPSYSPLFQTSFVYQRAQGEANAITDQLAAKPDKKHMDWGGLALAHYDLPQQEGQFDLELEMLESAGELVGIFKYNTNLFDAATIERTIGHYTELLKSIVENPLARIGDLPLLIAAEQQQLAAFNNTKVEYDLTLCLHEHFEAQVVKTPDAPAVVFAEKSLSYRELNAKANQLAHKLRSHGIGSDSLVGVFMERSLEMVVALYGIIKAGGAYVPLDPGFPHDRLAFMLEDAGFPVILTQANHAAALPASEAVVIRLDSEWDKISGMDSANPQNLTQAHHLAYVIYTSGSTGRPKGAMNSHRGICNRLLWMQDAYQLTGEDRVLQKTPYTFDVSVWEFFWPLQVGACLVAAKPGGHQDSAYLVDLINREKITTLHFVPPMLQAMLQQEGFSRCTSLRRVICSGEALPLDLQNRFFSQMPAELHNLYGPTEAAIDVTFWACERESSRITVPIGRPIANTQIHILDPRLKPTPIGIPGELHIGGVNVARGYLNRPELTNEKFIADPFSDLADSKLYKTGDLACYREDGVIDYLGRLDFQVKIRGFRIELGEIESTLCRHPSVAESLVLVRQAPSGDMCLVGYVVGQGQEEVSSNELRQYLKDRLPEYSIPPILVSLEQLPLSHNGKVDRKSLPAPAIWSGQGDDEPALPKDLYEHGLQRIWEEALGIHPIDVRHNFFDLGGHSLMALSIIAQIHREFGIVLPAATLFQAPTVEKLAEVMRERGDYTPWTPLVPIQPEGTKRPFFCVAGGAGSVMYYQPLAAYLGNQQPFYGLQSRGLDGETPPFETVQEMAAHNIEALKTVQPEGPYVLGGHCFGAVIAFEMARQMVRSGEVISLLAVINVPAPNLSKVKDCRQIDDATWVAQLGGLFEQAIGQSLNIAHAELKLLDFDGQLEYLKKRMVTAGILPPDTGIAPVRGLVQVYKANNRAVYTPNDVLPIPIALVRAETAHPDYDFSVAEQGEDGVRDLSLGWRLHALGNVSITSVPGDHITMMVPPNVKGVADALTQALNNAEQILELNQIKAEAPAKETRKTKKSTQLLSADNSKATGNLSMIESYSRWLLRWRYLAISVMALLCFFAAMGIGSLHFKNNYRMFFSTENPDLQAFDSLQNTYVRSDNVLIVLAPKDGQVFTGRNLATVETVTGLAWKAPFSTRVDSISNFQYSHGEEDRLEVADLVRHAEQKTPAELERIREIALHDPLLVGRLISPTGHVTGINITVERPGRNPMDETKAVTDFLAKIKTRIASEAPDMDVYLTGSVMMDAAFSDASEHDAKTLTPIMIVLIIVGLTWFFRSFSGMLVTVSVITLSIVTALGLAGWLGIKLSPSSVPAPTIMLTLAVADSVHFLLAYYDATRSGKNKHDAIIESLKLNLSAVFFTSITTAIGFLSMNFSDAPPFRDLGNITAMGVMAAFFLSVTLLPALIVLFPIPKHQQTGKEKTSGKSMQWFVDLVILKYKKWYFLVILVTALLISFIPRNELNDEFVKYFGPTTSFRQATDFAADNLTGIYYIDYSLGGNEPGSLTEPRVLAKIEEFANWYRQQPEVLHVFSITDIFKRLHKNLHADIEEWYRLPENRNLGSQYLMLYEMSLPFGLDLNDRVNVDKSATRMTVTLKSLSTNDVLALNQRAQQWLAVNAHDLKASKGTGLTMMFANIGARNISSMISGEIMSTILISFILIFVLRSLTLGLLSLIPNLVPAAVAFGLWGLLIGRVGLASSVVAAMTLGILVDDTVHFLGKYQLARREKNLSPEDSLRYAFSTVGNAIWVTSSVLMAGFALLALSDFKINAEMGLLTSMIFGLGLFAEFLLLPPLLLQIEAVKRYLGLRFPRLFSATALAINNQKS
jgi:amino acid adenylation domain-containing protein